MPTGIDDLDRFLALAEDAHEVRVDLERRRDAPQLLACDLEWILAEVRDSGASTVVIRAGEYTA